MAQELLFCFGCNERFDASGDDPACPSCGQALEDMITAPTLDMRAAAGRQTIGVASPADDELIGAILGNYRIDALAGAGGMARVYRAFHLTLERECALKVLRPALAEESDAFVELFVAEARAAASLVHPNIVTVHNIGIDRDLHFIEMELVDGRSSSRIAEAGTLDPARATALMMQAVAGLAEAHRRDIVHRDLKPNNILVTDAGVAKLADFGLAKRVLGAQLGVVGTPYFMAPELFEQGPATSGSDIYAAGVSFFFLLTGKLPFVASTLAEVVERHREQPIPDVRDAQPEVPEAAHRIVETCLAKRAEARYEDGAALHRELQSLYGSLRRLDELLDDALPGAQIRRLDPNVFEAHVALPEGRSQRVLIEKTGALLRVSSLCAPAKDAYARTALELNANILHGAIAIREHEGKPYFVATGAYPWATCDAEELRESVLSIAKWGDEVEKTLTHRDVH